MIKDFYKDIEIPKNFDKNLIDAAFDFAKKAHQGQKRKSGEDYILHPVAVARILLEIGMDAKTIAAALLHDVVEDTGVKIGEIRENFGDDVAMLVNGVTNLGQIDFSAYSNREEIEEAIVRLKNENLRQLFLAMSDDIRVVIIKLADRLHNMQTIKSLVKEDQVRIARETLNIFSPLALQLGMGEIKGELEDLAFPIAYPEEYKALKKEANRRYKAADRYVLHIKRLIEDKIKKEQIKAVVEGRSKHIYSLYKKIIRPEINWDFDKIYDLVAIRIITDTVEDCYRILGIIHGMYKPMPNYIRDYIASPKPNGYRSIHTSVFGPEGKIVEVQIRTHEMHEEAEYGVASHFHYTAQKAEGASDTKLAGGTFANASQTEFLKKVKEWHQSAEVGTEFIEEIKFEFLEDRIYVFSPKGDIYDLPNGATPVDFAYEVHSRIGDTCRGAKVNGRIVPLDFKLSTQDVVEIITAKNGTPKAGWLDFVRTSKAKQHIRAHFRKFDYDRHLEDGKKIVTDELKVLGYNLEEFSEAQLKDALAETSFKKIDDMYASVGAGLTTPRQALKIILRRSFIPEAEKRSPKRLQTRQRTDLQGMKVQIAPCCVPGKYDDVICYITRGRGLTAHKKNCRNLKSLESERLISYNPWKTEGLLVRLEVLSKNRVGLLRDITDIISGNGANIEEIKNFHPASGMSRIKLEITVDDMGVLSEIVKKAGKVKDVESVKRV